MLGYSAHLLEVQEVRFKTSRMCNFLYMWTGMECYLVLNPQLTNYIGYKTASLEGYYSCFLFRRSVA